MDQRITVDEELSDSDDEGDGRRNEHDPMDIES